MRPNSNKKKNNLTNKPVSYKKLNRDKKKINESKKGAVYVPQRLNPTEPPKEKAITHFVIDCETLGIRETAVQLSWGITAFRFGETPDIRNLINHSTHIKLKQDEIIKSKKFHTETKAIHWWNAQSQEVRDASLKPSDKDVTPKEALKRIREFFKKHNYDYNHSYIWCRGMDFDLPKFNYLFRAHDEEPFINPFKGRDIRTLVDILAGTSNGKYEPENKRDFLKLPKHIATADTIRDAFIMQELFLK